MVLLRYIGQSLAHLLVHAIFSTKDRRPSLHSEEIRNEIYAYMAGTLKNLDCHPIKIGGVEDHVHVFCSLSKNIAFYQEEIPEIFERHRVAFDERYVWD
jgi:REP element-mobilizing transposase RayT